MPKLTIHQLGPVTHCELEINDFMVFTGEQASGKSTIAKSVFLFKNIKNILYTQIKKQNLLSGLSNDTIELSPTQRLRKEIRANFLQIFGSTWCMDNSMYIQYNYSEEVFVRISLKEDTLSRNYIWIELSPKLSDFLYELTPYFKGNIHLESEEQVLLEQKINAFFADPVEVVYIPAGRSMITLLSTQLNYIYSSMDDTQKRNLDYCTQNYLERILKLKPLFNQSVDMMIADAIRMTDRKLDKNILFEVSELMKKILQGEYRNVDGEERLQVASGRYVKINFASSGQQESVWILNVLFYYLLNNIKAYFIIEEPESHLFPNAQKLMAEFIAIARKSGNQIFITTHSPYILGTFNNLLYANRIAPIVQEQELCKIVNKNRWLPYDKLSAFFIKHGKVFPCTDDEFEAIDNEVIDGASKNINDDFDHMVALRENALIGAEQIEKSLRNGD